jgi:uncharacterized membrane protein (UPF0127 family)
MAAEPNMSGESGPSGWSAQQQHPRKRGMPMSVKLLIALVAVGGAVGGFVGMRGCEQNQSRPTAPVDPTASVTVKIAGETFLMDPALDDASRTLGLGKRTVIPERGGMVFIFPYASVLQFVMRDCPVAIDVAFLDDLGRVMTIHEMQPEAPQRVDETQFAYESRLRKYSSRFPTRIAVEVAGGTLRKLGVKEGDRIEFDLAGLKPHVQ